MTRNLTRRGALAQRWLKVERWLTEPSQAVQNPDDRRRAQLLAVLLIFMLLIVAGPGLVLELVAAPRKSLDDPDFYVAAVSTVVLIFLFALSRTRYFLTGARLTVAMASLLTFWAAVPDSDDPEEVYWLVYLVLPILISSVLLSIRATGIVIVLQLIGMLAFAALVENATLDANWISFVLIVSVVIWVLTRHLQSLNQDRLTDLARSKAQTRTVLSVFPDLIFRLSRDSTVLDYEAGDRDTPLAASGELPGRKLVDVLPPEPSECLRRSIIQALESGQLQTFEFELPGADGQPLYFEARTIAANHDEVMTIVRNITQRKRTQLALRESEARYRSLFEDSPLSIWEEDFSAVKTRLDALSSTEAADLAAYFDAHPDVLPEYVRLVRVMNVNQVTLDLLGLPDKDALGGGLETVFVTSPFRLFRQELIAFCQGETRYQGTDTHTRPDGERRNIMVSVSIAPGHEDTWSRVLVSVVDITERTRAEEALRERDIQYRELFEGIDDAIWVHDTSGRILDANEAMTRRLGYSRDELLQMKTTDIDTPEFAAGFKDRIAIQLADGKLGYVAGAHVTRDGQRIEIEANTTVIRYQGEPAVLAVNRDVTERKQMQQAEREQRALAEALSDIATAINSTLDPDEVLDRILINIGRVVPHDASGIALIENGISRVVRSQGYDRYGLRDMIEAQRLNVTELANLRQMVETGQPVVVPSLDAANSPWQRFDDQGVMQSYVGAPISWDERVIGFIHVESTTPGFFSETHANRLRAFAAQAAVAIRNARLYDTIQRQVAELEALRQATLDISAELDLDALLQTLIERAIELLGVEVGGIYLYRADRDVLEWVVYAGKQAIPVGATLRRGEGLSGKVWKLNAPLVIPNYAEWAGRFPDFDTYAEPHTTVMGVPIRWRDHLLGVINARSDRADRAFTDQDVRLLELFASQAAIAIQNAQLFTAERDQRTLAEALRDTAAVINSTLDIAEVLEHILAHIGRVVSHDATNIMLIEADVVRVVASPAYLARWSGDRPPALYFPLDRSRVVRHVIETGQVYIVPDTQADPIWEAGPSLAWIRSHLSAPIRVEDRMIGLVNLDSDALNAFTAADAVRLQAFADQVALAIRNAQLYAASQRHATELETLHHITRDITSQLDLDALLQTLTENALRLLNAETGGIYLYRSDLDALEWAVAVGPNVAPLGTILQRGQGLSGQAWERNTTLIEHNYQGWEGRPDVYRDFEWTEVIAVPIRWKEDLLGVFAAVADTAKRTFSQHDVQILDLFVSQAAIAIQNAQLFAAERDQRALSDALRETATILNSTLEPDTVLEHILTSIQRVVPHDAANIMLIERETDIVYVAGARGYDDAVSEWLRDLRFPLTARPIMRIVRETGQAYLVSDTRLDEKWVTAPQQEWIRSYIACPIFVDNTMIGVINLDSAQPGSFRPDQVAPLEGFAVQAAIAINNARLYDELSRYAEELAVLYRGTSFLFTSLPPTAGLSDITRQIVETVVKTFNTVDCGLLLVEPETGQIELLARAGEYQLQQPPALHVDGSSLIPTAIRTGQIVYAADVRTDPRYLEDDPRTRSELVVPLRTAKGVFGVLDLQSTDANAFSAQDRRTLAAFAERAAAAIENRQLYDEVRRYTDELEQRVTERTIDLSVRNAVAETLSGSLDVIEMLSGVLETTVKQLGVLGGAIYLLSDDGASLAMVAHHGVPADTLNLVTGIIPGGSDLGLIENMPDFPQGSMPDLTQQTGISAVLSVPIWRQEQVQGVITLVHNQPRPWRSEETRMLDAIGRQIGVALANARLYDEAVHGEARIRTILQSIADSLLVFDQDANLILINPAAEAMLSFYPASQGGPARAAALVWDWLRSRPGRDQPGSPDDAESAAGPVEFALPTIVLQSEGGQNFATQCKVQGCPVARTGDLTWPCWLQPNGLADAELRQCTIYQRIPRRSVQAHSAEVRDAGGEMQGTVIALHDVTYFRELDDLKGRFVSTVSHELRTPLSAILLQVSTLLKYYGRFEDAERRTMVAEVQQQAYVLRELIEDILELSRFDAKRSMPQKQWFDIVAQYREVIAAMQLVIREKGLTLDASGITGSRYVMADPNQITRVLRNLLSNAVKYTPEGGTIALHLDQVGDMLRIAVSDTGIGIPVDEQVYIFDRFFRAEEAARMASGTGLGLSITKEIIDLHGGRIELRSMPGEGSTFTAYLPIVTPPLHG